MFWLPFMLHYTWVFIQLMIIVKVHRVFPSSRYYSASSQKFQFHWDNVRDSGEVVTPFMQVGTYPTRNFATLGPLWLQPPFTETYIQDYLLSKSWKFIFRSFFQIFISPFYFAAPGRCQTLYIIITFCRVLCFC